jgi:hypothetical protein
MGGRNRENELKKKTITEMKGILWMESVKGQEERRGGRILQTLVSGPVLRIVDVLLRQSQLEP